MLERVNQRDTLFLKLLRHKKMTREEASSLIKKELPGIYSLCHGKTVAVIGNAISAFSQRGIISKINKNKVVVRCNKGIAHRKLGRRCDIYCAAGSGLATKRQYRTNFPKKRVWMVDRHHKAKPKNFLFFPVEARQTLFLEIGIEKPDKPTTGVMAVYMVLLCNPKRIQLFGFDFWQTKTFYKASNYFGAEHKPKLEKKWLESLGEVEIF